MQSTAMQSTAIQQDLVLVGGGHSHAIVLQMWAMNPLSGIRLTLVSDRTHTPYSGMLPGHVAGFYNYDECHIDLRRLCQAVGVQFCLDSATGIDPEAQQLFCQEHPPIPFDWLSLDIGSTPTAVNVPGAAQYAIPAKPVPKFLQAWEALVQSIQREDIQPKDGQPNGGRGKERDALSLGIVGGGAGGVELAISMRARLRQIAHRLSAPPEIHLFQRGTELLPNHNRSTRRKLLQVLAEQNIRIHLNSEVTAITPAVISNSAVSSSTQNPKSKIQNIPPSFPIPYPHPLSIHHSGPEGKTDCDRLFWVTNASAPAWLAQSGLATDAQGFVLVNDTLQSLSHPRILAAGDIATMVSHPRPKAGVFAVRQGKPLFENLRSLLQDLPPTPFTPQRQLLALIGTGDGRAVASRGSWCLGPSKLLWEWKDWIDRQFMERFSELPVMGAMGEDTTPSAPGQGTEASLETALPPMYCSGCGAKVGKTSLDRVLGKIRADLVPADLENSASAGQDSDSSILLGLDTPDDAAVLQIPANRHLIQTVDYFQAIVSDPYIFGQITANHCLNDIFAMGAMPHSVLALAQIPHGRDRAIEAQLYQLLSGALAVLQQTQTTLIGGHTTEGDRLAFGLSCNGLADPATLWKKGGMQPGHTLILTKALGTGTLFAAQARGKAKGRWIDEAIASMLQSNAAAVEILRQHGTTACTDVTGFGLLGHLAEMVQASGLSATLKMAELPYLDGAKTTLEQGIVSSLHRQNLRARTWLAPEQAQAASLSPLPAQASPETFGPLGALLFDPQTSGGLLASLPSSQVLQCLEELHAAGFEQATVIGISQNIDSNSTHRICLTGR